MTARVAQIWRHPIKSLGRQRIDAVRLRAGESLPYDRHWAVAHAASDADGSDWVPCRNFTRVAQSPLLMAIDAWLDEAEERIALTHPDRPPLSFDPETQGAELIEWLRPLVPGNRPPPARIVRLPGRGMTDSDFASITLCNLASHAQVEDRAGRPLSLLRWRGNIWIDGLAPWSEVDWIGREVRIGSAVLRVRERTDRCRATHSDPATGKRDVDILRILGTFGHTDFSVRAEVVGGGEIAEGAPVELLPAA